MDIFKATPAQNTYKTITKENFEAETKRDEPWVQDNERGIEVHYAVCPACDNPIQIIGLYKLPKGLKHPYGKHYHESIPKLAPLNIEAREYCPYFKPSPYKQSDRKESLEGLPLKILDLLINQFDRVVYLHKKITGINVSKNMIRKMLETYRASEGYLYTGATLMNVPWIFSYMTSSQSLFGQRIDINMELISSIMKRMPEAEINEYGRIAGKKNQDGTHQFLALNICFIHHDLKRIDEKSGLTETMKMIVSTKGEKRLEHKDVYENLITFNHEHFQRLIHSTKFEDKRDHELVSMAEEILGDLVNEEPES